MGNIASRNAQSSKPQVSKQLEAQLSEMSPRLSSQRKRKLSNNTVLQSKLFKLRHPVQSAIYKLMAERTVKLVQQRHKIPSKTDKSPARSTGLFWNSYLLEALRRTQGPELAVTESIKSEILPKTPEPKKEESKQENEQLQQGQSVYQEGASQRRPICPSPVLASPTGNSSQSPVNKLAVKINNRLVMFQRESDEENLIVQPDFIQHIDLPSEWFESENQNSHQLKMMKMMRRLAGQNKLAQNTEPVLEQPKVAASKDTGSRRPAYIPTMQNINKKYEEQKASAEKNEKKQEQGIAKEQQQDEKKEEQKEEEKKAEEEKKPEVKTYRELPKAKPIVLRYDDSVSEGSDDDFCSITTKPSAQDQPTVQKQSGDTLATSSQSEVKTVVTGKSNAVSLKDLNNENSRNLNFVDDDSDLNKASNKLNQKKQSLGQQAVLHFKSAPACGEVYQDGKDMSHNLEISQSSQKASNK